MTTEITVPALITQIIVTHKGSEDRLIHKLQIAELTRESLLQTQVMHPIRVLINKASVANFDPEYKFSSAKTILLFLNRAKELGCLEEFLHAGRVKMFRILDQKTDGEKKQAIDTVLNFMVKNTNTAFRDSITKEFRIIFPDIVDETGTKLPNNLKIDLQKLIALDYLLKTNNNNERKKHEVLLQQQQEQGEREHKEDEAEPGRPQQPKQELLVISASTAASATVNALSDVNVLSKKFLSIDLTKLLGQTLTSVLYHSVKIPAEIGYFYAAKMVKLPYIDTYKSVLPGTVNTYGTLAVAALPLANAIAETGIGKILPETIATYAGYSLSGINLLNSFIHSYGFYTLYTGLVSKAPALGLIGSGLKLVAGKLCEEGADSTKFKLTLGAMGEIFEYAGSATTIYQSYATYATIAAGAAGGAYTITALAPLMLAASGAIHLVTKFLTTDDSYISQALYTAIHCTTEEDGQLHCPTMHPSHADL